MEDDDESRRRYVDRLAALSGDELVDHCDRLRARLGVPDWVLHPLLDDIAEVTAATQSWLCSTWWAYNLKCRHFGTKIKPTVECTRRFRR